MSFSYENEQFQLQEDQAAQSQLKNQQLKAQKKKKISRGSFQEQKSLNRIYKTIENNSLKNNKQPTITKSVSVYANLPNSKILTNNKKTSALTLGSHSQSLHFKAVARSKKGSLNDAALRNQQATTKDYGKRSFNKQITQNHKLQQRYKFQPNSKNKKLELTSINKSQSLKVSEYFYHTKEDLGLLSIDEINKSTNRLKEWIKKLDQALSDKIDKAIKERQTIKHQQVGPQKLIQLLKAAISNNKGLIKLIQSQYQKLLGHQGQLRQDQYQLFLDKESTRLQNMIKQQSQNIINLKKQSKLNENKASQTEYLMKYQKRLDFLKFNIMQSRRDQTKRTAAAQATQIKFEKINKMNEKISNKYNQALGLAKTMNIKLINEKTQQKYQQLKQKINKVKMLIATSQNYFTRTLLNTKNQIKNMRNQIRQYDEDIKHIDQKIVSAIKQSQTFMQQNKQKLIKLKMLRHQNTGLQKNHSRNPFIKHEIQQQQHKQELKPIKQASETNLLETQYHNQFLLTRNKQFDPSIFPKADLK